MLTERIEKISGETIKIVNTPLRQKKKKNTAQSPNSHELVLEITSHGLHYFSYIFLCDMLLSLSVINFFYISYSNAKGVALNE